MNVLDRCMDGIGLDKDHRYGANTGHLWIICWPSPDTKQNRNPSNDVQQGVAIINFRYEWTFEYIYIHKTIRMNIWIYSYQNYDTNEYPNIFVKNDTLVLIKKYNFFQFRAPFCRNCNFLLSYMEIRNW